MQNPRNNRPGNNRRGPNRNFMRGPIFYLLIILAFMGIFQLFAGDMITGASTSEITASEFIDKLADGQIKSFEIQAGSGVYNIRGEYVTTKDTNTTDRESFIQVLQNSSNATRFTTKILGNDATIANMTDLAQKTNTQIKTIAESNLTCACACYHITSK